MAPTDRKFWAFISYSHADEAWAKWLHVALERYRVPRPLVGRSTAKGVVPRSLSPIFRDRDELPGSSSLANEIGDALERSRSLIVICSPKAAVSKYVGNEIVTFKRGGHERDIFCLLVDGEPGATDRPESGVLEAFPAAIRYEVSADGVVTDERAEPLAADVRPGKDTRADAKLKIVAGMLGVGYDELKRRESRRRLTRHLYTTAASLAVLAVVAGIWWNRQRAVEGQQQIALSKQLAAQSEEYALQRPDVSSLLALAALDVSDTIEARGAVFAAAARTNQTITTIRGATPGDVTTLEFSADGRIFAVGTRQGRVDFRDSANGRQLGGGKGHSDAVTAVAFSRDLHGIASGSGDGTVVLWDTRTFETKMVLKADAGRVFDLQFSTDGKALRSVSERSSILWRVSDGVRLSQFAVQGLARETVIVSPDATRIGVAGAWLQLWDADSDALVATMKPQTGRYFRGFAFSRNERTVTTVDGEGAVVKWNADTGQEIRRGAKPLAPQGGFSRFAISADANVLATYGRAVSVFDFNRDTTVTIPVAGRKQGDCLAMSEDGQRLAWCGAEGSVAIWDRNAPPFRTSFEGPDLQTVRSVAFSRDGTLIASGDKDGKVILWSADGRQLKVLRGVGKGADSLAFGANGTIAGGMSHGPVTIWNTSKSERPITLPEMGSLLATQVAFNGDGSMLATATYEAITLWDAKSWQPVARMTNDSSARHIVFNREGTILATANGKGTVSLWDTSRHTLMATLDAHRGEVMGVAFSSNGERLASVGRDGTVIVWDVRSRKQVSRFDALDEIYSIAFSPDGSTFAHGGDNGRLILRDVQAFQQLAAIREHRDSVSSVAFSPDGRSLASTDYNSLVVWHYLSLPSWKERACMNAGRNLTRDEWQKFAGGREYRVLCPAHAGSAAIE